jgi:hypothetical protein
MLRHHTKNRDWYLAAALLTAVAAAFPLFSQSGFLNTRGGGDSPFLLLRLHQLMTALHDGHFPVRWMPDANYGYGYPFYNYYAPLSIYLAALFRLGGWGSVMAIRLAQVSGFLVAAWGMYRLAQGWFGSRPAALLASAAWTLAPFHMVNLYVRGDSLAEFLAMAFYPLTLLSADNLLTTRSRRAWLALAFSTAALILSHNISALIFTPFLGGYILLRGMIGRRGRPDLMPALTAGVAGLALSAWFWLPALGESSLAQLGPVLEGYFHYSNHFRSADLVQSTLRFDYDVVDGGAFRMGLVQAVAGTAGLIALLTRRTLPPAVRSFLIAGSAITTLMLTPWSAPLWEHLPLLAFTQFPWRFLSVQAFVLAGATGALAILWPRQATPVTVGLTALLLFAALGDLRPDYVAVAEPTAADVVQYEWFSGNIGTTISAEYLPQTVAVRPTSSAWLERGTRDEGAVTAGSAEIRLIKRQTTRQEWAVAVAGESAEILLPLLAWPGWQVRLNDGSPAPVTAAPGSGLVLLSLPGGTHHVGLALHRTALRLAGELLSLTALAGCAVLAWPVRHLSRRQASGGVILALLIASGHLWPHPAPPDGPVSHDFVQAAWQHHTPGGIRFADGVLLHNYAAPERAEPGIWELEAIWQGDAGSTTLALVPVADTRATGDRPIPPLARTTLARSSGTVTYRLTIPVDAPPGLYLPRLTRDDGVPALTTTGVARGALYLQPVRVSAEPPLTSRPDQPLAVTGLGVDSLPDGTLRVRLAWYSAAPLPANYQMTLQLDDSRTFFYAKHDGQPGYGARPTSQWPAGAWMADQVGLAWVADDGVPPYTLTAALYDPESGERRFVRRIGRLVAAADGLQFEPEEAVTALPAGVEPLAVRFGEAITLGGYTLRQEAGQLHLTLWWQAGGEISADYHHFVHLVSADGTPACPACQHDGTPQLGSWPTSQWVPGVWVEDPALIAPGDLPPGHYTLLVGLYEVRGDGYPRLAAKSADGTPFPHNAFPLPATITLPSP